MAAVDVTVVGTAMPTIVAQLGGLSLYPWVFSAYLLTSTVTIPLYGKAADLGGAGLLTAATTALLWAMLRAGDTGFADPWVLVCVAAAAGLGVTFVFQERRHTEPMIPPSLLRNRTVAITALIGVFGGGMLFGVSSYVPAFVQGVMGGDVKDAGLSVLAMGIGWPIASISSGWLLQWWSFRRIALLGGFFLMLGGVGLWTFGPETASWWVLLSVSTIGLGMGFGMTVTLIAAQEAVGWKERGAATGLVQFSRTIGGCIWVAARGAVLAGTLRSALADQPGLLDAANALMDPQQRSGVPEAIASQVRGVVGLGLGRALIGVGGMGICACLAMLAFPRSVPRPR
ncbi:MFS transporter [bacterium]|nr:MFS transporter [bacterium]